jgi:hypothetical protein
MGLTCRFASIEPQKKEKKRNYSVACGTPGVVRELVSAFLVSMPPGERPGKCLNEDNVEGPIAPATSLRNRRNEEAFSPEGANGPEGL